MLHTVLLSLATLGLGALALSPSECNNFRTTDLSETRALLSWNTPTTGEPSTGYLVHCKEDTPGDSWTRLAGRFFFDHTVDYLNLTPGTDYLCRCRAWSIGESVPKSSPTFTSFTAALPETARSGIPGDVVGLAATEWSDTTVRFEWTAPSEGGVATGYAVEYRWGTAPGQWESDFVQLSTTAAPQIETFAELTGIPPESTVQIKVKSVNAVGAQGGGNGVWSITFTTESVPTTGVDVPPQAPLPALPPLPSWQWLCGAVPYLPGAVPDPSSVFSTYAFGYHPAGHPHNFPQTLGDTGKYLWTLGLAGVEGAFIGNAQETMSGVLADILTEEPYIHMWGLAASTCQLLLCNNAYDVPCTPNLLSIHTVNCETFEVSAGDAAILSDGFTGVISAMASGIDRFYFFNMFTQTVHVYQTDSSATLRHIDDIALDQGHVFTYTQDYNEMSSQFAFDGHYFYLARDQHHNDNHYSAFDAGTGEWIGEYQIPYLREFQGLTFDWFTGRYGIQNSWATAVATGTDTWPEGAGTMYTINGGGGNPDYVIYGEVSTTHLPPN